MIHRKTHSTVEVARFDYVFLFQGEGGLVNPKSSEIVNNK